MWLVDALAEEHILAAQRRGEFDDLPGEGKPLQLDDDSAVPKELRVAYRILKNAGCLPPEQVLHNQITELEGLLSRIHDDREQAAAGNRLQLLKTRMAMQGRESNLLLEEAAYREKLARRMSR